MFNLVQTIKNSYHLLLALLANLKYNFPSRRLKVIGITGTDGKTTTTHLIYHILTLAGRKTSMVSSVFANIGGKSYDTGFHVTTPDIFPLQRFLSQSQLGGDEYFVLETTSHAITQNRVWGVKYKAAVLTNITHEHLDFHGDYESYLKSKIKLLRIADIAIVNVDDKSYSYIKKLRLKNVHTYGLKNTAEFSIDLGQKLKMPLPSFNRANYLAAYAACSLLGIDEKIILKALGSFSLPPGRIELLLRKPITVIVDFAHTPNGIFEILKNVKTMYLNKGGRIIHVFGSAERRDVTKRPIMGKSSGSFADFVILTEEDCRDEDPVMIANDIAKGLESTGFSFAPLSKLGQTIKQYSILTNREVAIQKAFKIARKNDLIILTGKGHEKSLCRGSIEYPWSDIEAAKKEISNISL